jgi:selenide,water dikinase
LAQVLRGLPEIRDPRVLVGTSTSDDAAVFALDAESALVQTLDFFTPLVDDPYAFGSVAAANALSDIYAMGAEPLMALNIVAFPAKKLPLEILNAILRGGSDKAREAGIEIVGGHSIDDPEPKYGLVVTGLVRRDRVVSNAGARPGDVLVLTKPLGTGIFTTALKRDLLPAAREPEIVALMATLNRAACAAMLEAGPHAATDVTGFGLLGHLHGMLRASGVRAEIDASRVPFAPDVLELAARGCVPGGTQANRRFVDASVEWGELAEPERLVLSDAQTSGGLLIAVPESRLQTLLVALERHGTPERAVLGRVLQAAPEDAGRIDVRGPLGAPVERWPPSTKRPSNDSAPSWSRSYGPRATICSRPSSICKRTTCRAKGSSIS